MQAFTAAINDISDATSLSRPDELEFTNGRVCVCHNPEIGTEVLTNQSPNESDSHVFGEQEFMSIRIACGSWFTARR